MVAADEFESFLSARPHTACDAEECDIDDHALLSPEPQAARAHGGQAGEPSANEPSAAEATLCAVQLGTAAGLVGGAGGGARSLPPLRKKRHGNHPRDRTKWHTTGDMMPHPPAAAGDGAHREASSPARPAYQSGDAAANKTPRTPSGARSRPPRTKLRQILTTDEGFQADSSPPTASQPMSPMPPGTAAPRPPGDEFARMEDTSPGLPSLRRFGQLTMPLPPVQQGKDYLPSARRLAPPPGSAAAPAPAAAAAPPAPEAVGSMQRSCSPHPQPEPPLSPAPLSCGRQEEGEEDDSTRSTAANEVPEVDVEEPAPRPAVQRKKCPGNYTTPFGFKMQDDEPAQANAATDADVGATPPRSAVPRKKMPGNYTTPFGFKMQDLETPTPPRSPSPKSKVLKEPEIRGAACSRSPRPRSRPKDAVLADPVPAVAKEAVMPARSQRRLWTRSDSRAETLDGGTDSSPPTSPLQLRSFGEACAAQWASTGDQLSAPDSQLLNHAEPNDKWRNISIDWNTPNKGGADEGDEDDIQERPAYRRPSTRAESKTTGKPCEVGGTKMERFLAKLAMARKTNTDCNGNDASNAADPCFSFSPASSGDAGTTSTDVSDEGRVEAWAEPKAGSPTGQDRREHLAMRTPASEPSSFGPNTSEPDILDEVTNKTPVSPNKPRPAGWRPARRRGWMVGAEANDVEVALPTELPPSRRPPARRPSTAGTRGPGDAANTTTV